MSLRSLLYKSTYLCLWYSYEHSQYVIWKALECRFHNYKYSFAGTESNRNMAVWRQLLSGELRSEKSQILENLVVTLNAFSSAPKRAIIIHNTSSETSVYADCGTVNIFSFWLIFSEKLTFKDKHFLPKTLFMWSYKTTQSSANQLLNNFKDS